MKINAIILRLCTSGWVATCKIGFNHEVETKILSKYLQLSCQEQVIILVIDSGFNTTGWYGFSFSQKIKLNEKINLSFLWLCLWANLNLFLTQDNVRVSQEGRDKQTDG